MNRRLVLFFPHNPCPPRSGAHHQCLAMIAALAELGWEVYLFASVLWTEQPWNAESVAWLKAHGVRDVVFSWGVEEDMRRTLRHERFYDSRFYRTLWGAPPLFDRWLRPPCTRRGFVREIERLQPQVVLMSYAHFDWALDHRRMKSVRTIIDTHDLVSLNLALQDVLRPRLRFPVVEWDAVPDDIMSPDFFERSRVEPDPAEMRVFDRYDVTLTLSEVETQLIRAQTQRTHVITRPLSVELRVVDNVYDGTALFVTGPNIFNAHGYLLFAKKILSAVLCEVPDFRLRVTGAVCAECPAAAGIEMVGWVPNIDEEYRHARFAVCPVVSGTGQMVKIVEAMANGVPVVAWRRRAEGSPICDGVNGLLADTEEEFAEAVVRLWRDPALCRRLGGAAREAVEAICSPEALCRSLAEVFKELDRTAPAVASTKATSSAHG